MTTPTPYRCSNAPSTLDARNASYFYNLGAARQFSGDFDGAELAYRRALELAPDLYRAQSSLVQLKRATPIAITSRNSRRLFARSATTPTRSCTSVTRSRSSSKISASTRGSFDWLERAKAAKRNAVNYDGARRCRDCSPPQPRLTAARARSGNPSEEPIFIVGMPRTGTTLVDRILSSHPDVFSAGELTDFALVVKRMTGTPSNKVLDAETLAAGTTLDFAALGCPLSRQHASAHRSHARASSTRCR